MDVCCLIYPDMFDARNICDTRERYDVVNVDTNSSFTSKAPP